MQNPNQVVVVPLKHYYYYSSSSSSNSNSNSNSSSSEAKYVDEWLASIIKPSSFYQKHASPGRKRKHYFYNIDLQGRLFLEETHPKNIATSMKDTKFLDFFFRQVRPVTAKERKLLLDDDDNDVDNDDNNNNNHADADDYPFVSPCGLELNFIRPADSVIVFHNLRPLDLLDNYHDDDDDDDKENVCATTNSSPSPSPSTMMLTYGGTLVEPFVPSSMAISKRTGRLYHKVSLSISSSHGIKQQLLQQQQKLQVTAAATNETNQSSDDDSWLMQAMSKGQNSIDNNKNDNALDPSTAVTISYGLIKTSVAVTLSEFIVHDDNDDEDDDNSNNNNHTHNGDASGWVYVHPETHERTPIPYLPSNAEPGPWSLTIPNN